MTEPTLYEIDPERWAEYFEQGQADLDWYIEHGVLVPVEPLDTNDAEREGIDSPWFEVGPIYLPNEKRDKFRVAVYGIGGDDEE